MNRNLAALDACHGCNIHQTSLRWPISRIGGRCLDILFDIWSLHRERRALQSFDDRALKDIGLTRADIEQELAKPFWRR